MAGATHLLGQSMGRYLIQSVIGSGGFATVYRAVDTTLERPVALKVVDPTAHRSPTIGRRFVLEGRAVASLNHPAIVPVYDAGESDGVLWLAMRLIEGSSLDHALASGRRFVAEETLALIDRIGAALDNAHANGIVHRDVKPSNILLEDNDASRAWLADFGIAATARTAGLYTTGALGTAAYMAPEQSRPSEVGPPADVYSLACVAYEMLIGQRPFPGDDYVALLLAHATAPVPLTGQGLLDELMARALAKLPTSRPASGMDLAREVRAAVSSAPSALPPQSPVPLRIAAAGSVPTVVDDLPGEAADGVPGRSADAPATLIYPTTPVAPAAAPGMLRAPRPAEPAHQAAPTGPQPNAGPAAAAATAGPGAPVGSPPQHRPPPPPPGYAPLRGPLPGFHPGGLPTPPRDPTVVRTSRRGARRLLLVGGLILLVGTAAAAVALIELGQAGTQPIEDAAGVDYRVPSGWVRAVDPPAVTWSDDGTPVLRLTHAPSGESDAVNALQNAEPAVCSVDASSIDIVGADSAALCNNPEDAPATAVGVLADGELWIITLDRSVSSDTRDEFRASLDFSAEPPS